MAKFEGFDCFTEHLFLGKHNFIEDEFRVLLTNKRPVKELRSMLGIVEVPTNRNYKSGGKRVKFKIKSTTRQMKVYALKDIKWTRKYKDVIGPFQFVVLYNYTKKLPIGYYDYGNILALATPDDRSFTANLATTRDTKRRISPTFCISR